MIRRLYHWVLALAASPAAPFWLFGVAFAEASFFPVPPDVLLVAMALANPRRAWRLAAIATAGSVLGGALGWVIGYALFNQIAAPILHTYGYGPAFHAFQARFAEWGVWIVLIKGLTPIPYKIVTIAAGAAAFNFPLFMLASLVTRGGRFFLVAALLRRFGAPMALFIEQRLMLLTTLLAIAIIGGFLALRYL